jgi:MSHA biogenesis protein MshQ
MKKIIAGFVFFVMTAAALATTTYTFSGTSFPACSNGGWSGNGTVANPYTCNGSFSLASGDSISPSSSITILANGGITLAGSNTVGASSITVNLQTTSGDITIGSGGTIYGGLTASSGDISLTGTTLTGSINTNGKVTLSGGSITGSVSGKNGVTATNGTTIGGSVTSTNGSVSLSGGSVAGAVNGSNGVTASGTTFTSTVTANNGSISLSGGSATGAVHSDCCTVTTSNTNLFGGISSNSSTVTISGGTISGAISTSGGNGVIISGANITSGSITTGTVPVSITNSTIGSSGSTVGVSAQNQVSISGSTVYGNVSNTPSSNQITIQGSTINGNVTGNNDVTIANNSVVNGNATAGNWNGALSIDSSSFVNGVCSSNTNSVASPSDPQYKQCTGGVNNPGVGSFNAFETTVLATATTGNIYTKLSNTGFSLAVVAIANGGVATSWNGTVTVSLIANTASAPGGASCPAGYGTSNALASTTVTITKGRGTATFGAINTAYQDVRAYIVSSSPAVSVCSTDKFAIRPATLTLNALAGTPLTSIVTSTPSTTATPTIKAGSSFTLTATAAGYVGTPTIISTSGTSSPITVANGLTQGAFSGTFDTPAKGTNGNTASGASFTYSEVAYFNLATNAVYDSNFTVVDQSSDCNTNSTSNTADSSGRYGCYIGTAALNNIGRFIPDHLSVAATPACSSVFTYSGQPFTVKITALNASGGTTKNYDTSVGYAKQVTLSDASASPAVGTWSNNVIASTMFASGVTSSSTATTPTPTFTFSTLPSVPAILQVRATENSSSGTPAGDGVSSSGNDGSAAIRLGRLRLFNSYGAVGTTLSMPVQAQYWSKDAVWVQNSDDSCTVVGVSNVYLSSSSVAAGASTVSISGGAGNLSLTTTATGTTSSNVVVNLGATGSGSDQSCLTTHGGTPANEAWLRSQNGSTGSCASLSTTALWQRDPMATASFGVFSPESKYMIHMREAYW